MLSQQNQSEHPKDDQEIADVVKNDVHTNLHFCNVSAHWFLPSSHIETPSRFCGHDLIPILIRFLMTR